MSARKLESFGHSQKSVTLEARQSRLSLSHDAVVIRKGGMEFRSPTPFSAWKEMTVELQTPDNGKVHCTGVVIGCAGNKHAGYHVSLVFTGMSRQAQAKLTTMSHLAPG